MVNATWIAAGSQWNCAPIGLTNWPGRFGLDEYSWRYMQRIETYPPNIGWDGGEHWYDEWINCW